MKFDDVLVKVGEFGRYQTAIYLIICVMTIPSAFNALVIVFLGAEVDHWCSTPEWDGDNCTSWGLNQSNYAKCSEAKRNASIPIIDQNSTSSTAYSQCKMYNISGTHFVPLGTAYRNLTTNEHSSLNDYRSRDVIPCTSGWEYDRSRYKSTINMDFNLVCHSKNMVDISSSFWFVGILVGSVTVGYLADRIGRYWSLCLTLICQLILGMAVAFSPSYWCFAVLRALLGTVNVGIFIVSFVLSTEFVGPSKRVIVGMGLMIVFSIGYMCLALLAYFIRNWRHLQLVISGCVIPFIFCLPIIPESVRWLLSRGKLEEANGVIQTISKVNKVPLPENIFESDIEEKKNKDTANVLDLFRSPNLRIESFNLMFNWMVESLVYYGLALSSSDFGVNPYIAAFVSGAVEIPAYVSSIFALEYFGRRPSTCVYLVIGGTACIGTIFFPNGIAKTALAMVGKFGITASFSIIYIFTAELYPTPVRSLGLGMCSMASRIGGIIAPQIRILGRMWMPLPAIIYGLTSITAGLLALLLPETKGRKLPETMEEGENLRNCKPRAAYVEVPVHEPKADL